MTILALLLLGLLAIGLFFGVKRLRKPEIIMWQFGYFENTRPGHTGIPGSEGMPGGIDAEIPIVIYDDWKYWIRLKPNPGINLPWIGYWSRAFGRKRPN